MRVLLDEQIDKRLARRFSPEFQVRSVHEVGWGAMKNGALLRAAEQEYDAFVTMDRGIPHQQNLPAFRIGVVVIRARSNRLDDVAPLVARIEAALREVEAGTTLYVAAADG